MYISISQEMVRFKKIHDSYCGIFANMSVFIHSVPRVFYSWFHKFLKHGLSSRS